MTNTIPNVPRELPTPYELATHEGRKLDESRSDGYCGSCSIETHIAQLKDPKSWVHSYIKVWEKLGGLYAEDAPSPAGVDGDFGWLLNLDLPEAQCNCQWNPDSHDKTCPVYLRDRLSDAQAIIGGLRVDVEVMTQHANNYSRMFEECAEERDQQAKRIGELEQILRDLVPGCKWRFMRPRIDAALSAGKER